MPTKTPALQPLEPREFRSVDEIEAGIAKLKRRILDLEQLDVASVIRSDTGANKVVQSDTRETIREVFGTNSPEFRENGHLQLWLGGSWTGMEYSDKFVAIDGGRKQAITIVNGLIKRLEEKKEEIEASGKDIAPSSYFKHLNLHPRILDVSQDLFLDGYHMQAVFEASKALVNYVKERSRRDDLDGAPLMRAVFSKNNPILAFSDLTNSTEQDEQEGMMHLFEGAALGIRNPGGHAFPEGTEQRAVEYLSLLSLLAYRAQEAKLRASPK